MQNNFTWYLKFHAGGPTRFSQVQRSLNIYSIMVSLIWRRLCRVHFHRFRSLTSARGHYLPQSDRVEVCELVGSFLLYALSLKYNKTNIGLYRDDGLAVFRNVSGAHCEKIKKEFQKLFRQHGLKLIIKCNLKIVDFLNTES